MWPIDNGDNDIPVCMFGEQCQNQSENRSNTPWTGWKKVFLIVFIFIVLINSLIFSYKLNFVFFPGSSLKENSHPGLKMFLKEKNNEEKK